MPDGLDADAGGGPAGQAVGAAPARGPGRVLVAVYAVFAVAASSRAAYQIATDFDAAPLAYLLSAFAAVVYLIAAYGFASDRGHARLAALVACVTELVGVVVVGTVSLALPADFPEATVWSAYGRGYLFVPLVLPVLGLLWLRQSRAKTSAGQSAGAPTWRAGRHAGRSTRDD